AVLTAGALVRLRRDRRNQAHLRAADANRRQEQPQQPSPGSALLRRRRNRLTFPLNGAKLLRQQLQIERLFPNPQIVVKEHQRYNEKWQGDRGGHRAESSAESDRTRRKRFWPHTAASKARQHFKSHQPNGIRSAYRVLDNRIPQRRQQQNSESAAIEATCQRNTPPKA